MNGRSNPCIAIKENEHVIFWTEHIFWKSFEIVHLPWSEIMWQRVGRNPGKSWFKPRFEPYKKCTTSFGISNLGDRNMVLSGHKLSPYHFAGKFVLNTSSTMCHSFQRHIIWNETFFFSDFNALIFSEGRIEIIISIIFDVMNESELNNDISVCH